MDENINSNCTLKNYIEFKNNELLSIISNEDNIIPMNCSFKLMILPSRKGNSSKSSIIIIILVPIFLIIILVSFIFICLAIKNNKKINPNINEISSTYRETTANVLD